MGFIKRFFKGALMTATLLASMTFANAQTGISPNIRFLETDQVLPAGLWRIRLDGDVFTIDKNTNASNNFATATTAISIAANGDVTIPQDFFVTGSATVSVDTSITGNLVVSSVGPHSFGAPSDGSVRNYFSGAYLSTSSFGQATHVWVDSTLTGTAGDTQALSGMVLDTIIITQSATESIIGVAQLIVDEPQIVVNLTGGGQVLNAASIMIPNVPTEASINNAGLLIGEGEGSFNQQIGTYNAIIIDQADRTTNGQDDSGKIQLTGVSYDGSAHDSDWLQFVDVTSNAGASLYTYQSQIDAAGYVNAMTLSASELSLPATSSLDWGGDTKLFRDGAWELGLRDGSNDMFFYVYAEHTNSTNYERLAIYAGGDGEQFIEAQTAGTGTDTVNLSLISAAAGSSIQLRQGGSGNILTFNASSLTSNQAGVISLGSLSTPYNDMVLGGFLFLGTLETSPTFGIVMESVDLVAPGQRDSHSILYTGKSHDGSAHDVDWETFVDVTSNPGASTFKFRSRIDVTFADRFSITDAGDGTFTGDLAANSAVLQGSLTIDDTNVEALIVRQDADGGDIFIVDTTNDEVDILTGRLEIGREALLPYDAIVLDNADLVGPDGVLDSSAIIITGQSRGEGTRTDLDWKIFANMTGVGAQSRLLFQQRDGNSNPFVTQLSIKDTTVSTTDREDIMSSYVSVGNLDAFDSGSLGSNILTDNLDPTTANWAVAGDFSDGASESVYLHSSGTGTLTQINANLTTVASSTRWWRLLYTVSNVTAVGTLTANLSNTSLALNTVALDVQTAGANRVVYFKTSTTAETDDFIISGSSSTASDGFTLDSFTLMEVTGGDVVANNLFTGVVGSTNGIKIEPSGAVILDHTEAEAFLVRIDSDGGDVFTVNTSTPTVTSDAQFVVDITSTEALLVRKNADGGDVFAVNTDTSVVSITGAADITAVSVNGTPTSAIGSSLNIESATAILATTSGTVVTATSLIPAGSFVVGIVTRVNDLVTGPAGYDVGDGTDVDRWGNSILVAADTTSDITDFTSSALTLFPAANDVVVTSDGAAFSAGNIRVTVYYMSLTAPTVD